MTHPSIIVCNVAFYAFGVFYRVAYRAYNMVFHLTIAWNVLHNAVVFRKEELPGLGSVLIYEAVTRNH